MIVKTDDTIFNISNEEISFNYFGLCYELQIINKSANDSSISYICFNKDNGNNSEIIIESSSIILFKENDLDIFSKQIIKDKEPVKFQVEINHHIPKLNINYGRIKSYLKKIGIIIGVILSVLISLLIVGLIIDERSRAIKEKQRIESETITQQKIIGSYNFDMFKVNNQYLNITKHWGEQQIFYDSNKYDVNGKIEISDSKLKFWIDKNLDNKFVESELTEYKYNSFQKLSEHQEGIINSNIGEIKINYYETWIKIAYRIGNDDYEIRATKNNF